MKVVITGGCGFIGQVLAREILQRGTMLLRCGPHSIDGRVQLLLGTYLSPSVSLSHCLTAACSVLRAAAACMVALGSGKLTSCVSGPGTDVTSVVLADISAPPAGQWVCPDVEADARVSVVTCDIGDPATATMLVDQDDISVFHLSAIMSGQGEEDPDLCYRVNFDGTRALLETCRHRATCPRVIITTAGATFSGGAEMVVTDELRSVPATTYGTSKRMCELLLNDYTRKGWVDGRAGRLSSVIVRAGAPNAATTGAYSSVVREPLSGVDIELPIADDVSHAVCGHRGVVRNLLLLHEASTEQVRETISLFWIRSIVKPPMVYQDRLGTNIRRMN